ncbi:MAG: alcohol dehydrogenase catalytic domain-containing protein [Gemmatimonadetes bacterium]|nr:alcohol dehydrogenase catalytic domain-containing protein [Gemmatimonadota bacterium]
MRAALFHENGGPDVVRVEEVPTPEPGPGEVRLKVRAAALNHLDLWVRRGLPNLKTRFPHVGGSDMAGEVDAVGPGVEGVEPGTRVVVDPSLDYDWYDATSSGEALPPPRFRILGEHLDGGFAERVAVPQRNLYRLPEDVDLVRAAAAPLVYQTAWRALASASSSMSVA